METKTVFIVLKNGLPLVSYNFFGNSKNIPIHETREQAEKEIEAYHSDTTVGSDKMTIKSMKVIVP